MGASTLISNFSSANLLGPVRVTKNNNGVSTVTLEPGAYKLEFTEKLPFSWLTPTVTNLIQGRLIDAGMHLTLNLNPLSGLLNVEYRTTIEDNTILATLLYYSIVGNDNGL